MDGFISEIRYFGPNWAPRNWFPCDGRLLAISQFTAFYSLIGTLYGGDGRTTFALPDLRGRVPVGSGGGPGLTPRSNGQRGGIQSVTLNITEIPSHSHSATTSNPIANGATATVKVNNSASNTITPEGNYPGLSQAAPIYETSSNATMANDAVVISNISFNPIQTTIGLTGGNSSHENMQPWTCVLPIICYQGEYPSRN
ncbi:phage tail protein [Fulvivirga sediminis]|uniref:Tail fiber protein n=1 Tax=Fulvivirga sediminis TaxID=2803949 RepID=A0A937FCY7_9BACT|nr:tail fiber protein [Fulvivirga sediminis]MBL3658258.1 tail fiber protein [Fulvivirga sediminis]